MFAARVVYVFHGTLRGRWPPDSSAHAYDFYGPRSLPEWLRV